jgi:hypothetical protein
LKNAQALVNTALLTGQQGSNDSKGLSRARTDGTAAGSEDKKQTERIRK